MTDTKKNREISRDTYLRALGLFHLASDHYAKAFEFEASLARLLEFEDGYAEHVSDAMTDESRSFDQALAQSGISVVEDIPND